MSFLVLMPAIYPPYRDECITSMGPLMKEHLVVIDNTERNRGLAASWNIGARRVLDEGLDWLVTISAAMRFGRAGGADFLAMLDANPQAWVIESGWDLKGRSKFFGGWHLMAWSRERVLEPLGLWDENFWPIYGEDADYSVRLLTAIEEAGPTKLKRWPKLDLDAWLVMTNHSGELAGIVNDYPDMDVYFRAKWGRSFGDGLLPTFRRPFDDPSRSLSWWPSPPDPLARSHDGWALYDAARALP